VRRAYTDRLRASQDQLTATLNRNNVERIPVRTDLDYLPALRAYFRSRKRR
jgi:hypothetical protein